MSEQSVAYLLRSIAVEIVDHTISDSDMRAVASVYLRMAAAHIEDTRLPAQPTTVSELVVAGIEEEQPDKVEDAYTSAVRRGLGKQSSTELLGNASSLLTKAGFPQGGLLARIEALVDERDSALEALRSTQNIASRLLARGVAA